MVKPILLVVFCLPLVWVGCMESRTMSQWSKLQAPDPGHGPDPVELAALAKNAQDDLDSAAPVQRSVLCLDDPEPGPARPPFWVQALVKHGDARRDARKKVETERLKAQEAWEQLTRLQNRIRAPGKPRDEQSSDLDDLDKQLEAYRNGPVHDEELYQPVRDWVDWIRLDRAYPERSLNDLYQQLDQWTPAAPLTVAGDPGNHPALNAYRAFLIKHDPVGSIALPGETADLVKTARERTTRWDLGLKLATVLNREKASGSSPRQATSWPARAAQIRDVAALAAQADQADLPTAEVFKRTARRAYGELCRKLIPMEALDEKIKVPGHPTPYPRDEVLITLVGRDQPQRLRDSGYDEYKLTGDRIKGLTVRGMSVTVPAGTKPILPTEYSEAVHAFNDRWSEVKEWNEAELKQLLSVCEEHRTALQQGSEREGSGGNDLIPRIERLLEIVKQYPGLFTITR
jgi:hypothetical protein